MAPTPTSGACWNGAVAMSNKPPKHSEVKKKESAAKRMKASWGKSRSAAPSFRIRPERLLIVTEGTKTEPYYFEGFKNRINAGYHGEYVTLRVCGVGDNTVSLFERARSIASADPDGFTQVWVVYDKDSFPSRDFNAVVDLCSSESGGGVTYRAAWTNEAFELWYILHFAYVDSALDRGSYAPILTRYLRAEGLGKYEKNRSDMFSALEGRMPAAIANAERLEGSNAGRTPADSNPGTTVHLLVKELLPYLNSGALGDRVE